MHAKMEKIYEYRASIPVVWEGEEGKETFIGSFETKVFAKDEKEARRMAAEYDWSSEFPVPEDDFRVDNSRIEMTEIGERRWTHRTGVMGFYIKGDMPDWLFNMLVNEED